MSDLTLEKLKISEKLDALSVSMAVLMDSHKYIEDIIRKHQDVLYGNGKEGLLIKLDRLEQGIDSRKWQLKAMWATLTAILGKLIHLSLK